MTMTSLTGKIVVVVHSGLYLMVVKFKLGRYHNIRIPIEPPNMKTHLRILIWFILKGLKRRSRRAKYSRRVFVMKLFTNWKKNVSFARLPVPKISIATFRSDYEYEIEYEYNFSIPGHGFKIVICPNNIVPIVSFSTGHQQGGTRALRT